MPAGTGPFGIGTPAVGVAPPTGAAGSRFIDPRSGDFIQDDTTKQLGQMPAVRQRVLLAIATLRQSATALPLFGIVLPPKITATYRAEVEASIRSSLRQMTDVEGVLRLDAITIERGSGGRSQVTVSFTDVTTGESGRASA
jgi:hypothetical protein